MGRRSPPLRGGSPPVEKYMSSDVKRVEVELVRSVIGTPRWMRTIVRTLGLRKLRSRNILPDNGSTRGMVKKVCHLVTLRELGDASG